MKRASPASRRLIQPRSAQSASVDRIGSPSIASFPVCGLPVVVGKSDAATARKFADAIEKLRLPQDSAVHYEDGDPASGILAGARKLSVELLIAGALERKPIHRQFLGDVARRLVREAACSVMLFTQPELEPKPFRHIVFMAEYSDHAQRALRRTLQLAEKENCERLYVIRNYTSFDKARAARQGKSGKGVARTLEEEEMALQEFILAAGNHRDLGGSYVETDNNWLFVVHSMQFLVVNLFLMFILNFSQA